MRRCDVRCVVVLWCDEVVRSVIWCDVLRDDVWWCDARSDQVSEVRWCAAVEWGYETWGEVACHDARWDEFLWAGVRWGGVWSYVKCFDAILCDICDIWWCEKRRSEVRRVDFQCCGVRVRWNFVILDVVWCSDVRQGNVMLTYLTFHPTWPDMTKPYLASHHNTWPRFIPPHMGSPQPHFTERIILQNITSSHLSIDYFTSYIPLLASSLFQYTHITSHHIDSTHPTSQSSSFTTKHSLTWTRFSQSLTWTRLSCLCLRTLLNKRTG